MGIVYKTGCLIEAFKSGEVGVIAHQANCQNTMKSGVALDIKEKLPEAYAADQLTAKGSFSKMGKFSKASTAYGDVFNLYGQYSYGRGVRHTCYEALEGAMEMMSVQLIVNGYEGTIGLPKIGAGTGGGDWDIISGIIEETLCPHFKVIVYLKEV